MSSRQDSERLGVRLGRFLALVLTIFAISFGVIVATRLSEESMSMVVGIVLGFAVVGIPLALLGVIAWLGARIYEARASQKPPAAAQPPVIVMPPMMEQGFRGYQPQLGYDNTAWTPRAPRQFEVIGDEDTNTQEERWERR